MLDGEPFKAFEVKRRIREILETGSVATSKHADEEMAKDGLTDVDLANLLRGGVCGEGEWENGCWRYHVRSSRMCFVIAFKSETELRVVTAWREKNG